MSYLDDKKTIELLQLLMNMDAEDWNKVTPLMKSYRDQAYSKLPKKNDEPWKFKIPGL